MGNHYFCALAYGMPRGRDEPDMYDGCNLQSIMY